MGRQATIALATFATGLILGGLSTWVLVDANTTALESDLLDTQAANQEMQMELDRKDEYIQQLQIERTQRPRDEQE